MSEHHPGPWEYDGIDVWAEGDVLIATIQSEEEGDGILIAASPNLLEACKAAKEKLERLSAQFSTQGSPFDCSEELSQINEAIRLAEDGSE